MNTVQGVEITARPRANNKKAENEKKASNMHKKAANKIDKKAKLKEGRKR